MKKFIMIQNGGPGMGGRPRSYASIAAAHNVLIICPASLRAVWADELRKRAGLSLSHVLIYSYQKVQRDGVKLLDAYIGPNTTVVLDEPKHGGGMGRKTRPAIEAIMLKCNEVIVLDSDPFWVMPLPRAPFVPKGLYV